MAVRAIVATLLTLSWSIQITNGVTNPGGLPPGEHDRFLQAVKEQQQLGAELGMETNHASLAVKAEAAAVALAHAKASTSAETKKVQPQSKEHTTNSASKHRTAKRALVHDVLSASSRHTAAHKRLSDANEDTATPNANKSKVALPPKLNHRKGDKSRYPKPARKPSPPKPRKPPAPPVISEGVMEPKLPEVPGFPIKPNLNSFMYYERIVSLYLLPTEEFADRKYIKMGNEEKLLLSKIAQDEDRKQMSFKLHRALAYTGEEAFGAKPFCYSFQPAYAPNKWLVVVRNEFFTVKTIKNAAVAPLALRRAASFCVTPKKGGKDRDHAISFTTWDNVDMVWRAVGKYVSLGAFTKKRRKLFTAASATFVVQFGLFHGLCWRGPKKKCECDDKYYGRECHKLDCTTQKEQKKDQCNGKGICQKKFRACSCSSGWFGHDCQRRQCPSWGPVAAERTCNHRGSCNTKTKQCVCDPGWSGKACEKGFCPKPNGNACSGHGKCDTATGICTCGDKHWGRACEKKKCGVFFSNMQQLWAMHSAGEK